MNRFVIVHGWSSSPSDGWFPWLEVKLQERGYEVVIPAMPHPDVPTIDAWVDHLRHAVDYVDEQTFFIGHSIGCQAILRYLETQDARCGGAVFVAGWVALTGLETEEEKELARPWLATPLDVAKIQQRMGPRAAIFSDDDRYVPLAENREFFERTLGAEIIVEHAKGHFSGHWDKVFELPSALDAAFRIATSHGHDSI